jgi:hypothetical protein
MERKVICRKCGGPHFTIKCGKEKKEEIIEKPIETSVEKPIEKTFNKHIEKPKKQYFKTTYRVKISELPTNITEEEMMELTCDWGHVVKIRVINYNESSVAYIDFGYEDEADYFVRALDKTPFELLIISVSRVSSERT